MFKWLFGSNPPVPESIGEWDDDYRVVGVTFDNPNKVNRQQILKKCNVGQDITLKRKPSKQFPDAIEVWSKYGQIGHIDADDASLLAPVLDRKKRFKVTIKKITGGTTDKPTLGCIISLMEQ